MVRFVARLLCVVLMVAVAGCTDKPSRPATDEPARPPVWSTRLPDEVGAPQVSEVASGSVVVRAERGVAVLDADSGAVRWHRSASAAVRAVAVTTAGVVFVADDRVRVLDLATGGEKAAGPAMPAGATVTLSADTAYVAAQDERNYVPRLVAVDLASGVTRWQQEFAGFARATLVSQATGTLSPPALAAVPVATRGEDGRVTVVSVDARTGQRLATVQTVPDERGVRLAGPDTLLVWDPAQTDCAVGLAAHDVRSGAERWRATIGQWQLARPLDPATCKAPGYIGVEPERVLTLDPDERPQVRELRTGRIVWTGAAGDYPLTTEGNTVVVRAGHATGPLVGHDVSAGKQTWSIDLDDVNRSAASPVNKQTTLVGGHLVVTLDRRDRTDSTVRLANVIAVYDAASGAKRWTSGTSTRLCGVTADGVIGCQSSGPVASDYPNEVRRYRF